MALSPPQGLGGEAGGNDASDAAPAPEHHCRATRQIVAPRRTDHTYHDWTSHPPDDYSIRSASKKSNSNFVSIYPFLNRDRSVALDYSLSLLFVDFQFSLPSCTGSCRVPSMAMPFVGSPMVVVSSSV
jgi:hypothetical protein